MSIGTMAKMRLFTQEEANASLLEVGPWSSAWSSRRALVALGEELDAMQALIGGNGGASIRAVSAVCSEGVARAAAG